MSGGWSLLPNVVAGQAVGADTATSRGTAVVPGTANVYGTWTQLIAATAYDATELHLSVFYSDPTNFGSDGAVSIGIGGAGSEHTIINDWAIGSNNPQTNCGMLSNYLFPIMIPAGTRVAARTVSNAGTTGTFKVALKLFDGGFTNSMKCAGVDSMGFTLASTSGVAITPSATAHTLGSWVQVIAVTTRDYGGLICGFFTPSSSPGFGLLQIGLGAAASEVVIVPFCQTNSLIPADTAPTQAHYCGNISIPKGSRLAARQQQSAASGPAQPIVLYGLYR